MIGHIIKNPVRTVGGFASGFRYPLVAAFYILRHPSLWPWCILPIIINIIVIVLLWLWTGRFSDRLVEAYVTDAAGWFWEALRKGAEVLVFLGRVVITLVAFVVVGSFAALPFNDLLSEQTDKLAGGWNDPRPFSPVRIAGELAVTGLQEGKRMILYLSLVVPLFLLSFIPLFAPFTLILNIIVSAMFFTSDYLAYPMERRGALMFRHKFMIARRYFFPSLGFGCAVTLMALVPVINFIFFPLAVVGGTLFFNDLVRQYGQDIRTGLPANFNPYGPPGIVSFPPTEGTSRKGGKAAAAAQGAMPVDARQPHAPAPPPLPPPAEGPSAE